MTYHYDFDTIIERRGTGCLKVDALGERFGRDDIRPMWIADMDFAVAPAILQALTERLTHPILGYPSISESYFRSIISWADRRHGLVFNRDEVCFIPGVVRGIAYAVNYFTRPGEGVIIQPPVYHPFKMVIEGNQRRAVVNPLVLDVSTHRYSMDLALLEQQMADPTVTMMVLCNPHNPSGIQWDAETLAAVAAMARRHGVVVVSDEIHGDLMLWGKKHIPFLSVSDDARAVGIMLAAPSKTFNIPGLVSSWMVVKSPAMRDGFYRWMEANEFSDPMLLAMVATEAAYNEAEDWLDELIIYLQDNFIAVEKMLGEEFAERDVRSMRPDASFLGWLDFTRLGQEQQDLVDMIINHAGLALNDGEMFGTEGRGFMRLNVASPRQVVLDSVERIVSAVKKVANPLNCKL